MVDIIIPKLEDVKVKIDGGSVALVSSKGGVIRIPWQAVKTLTKYMVVQAGKIEEMAKRDQIIRDQAIMMRTGAPFGLTNNPDIQKEAAKVAQYDPKLRKYLPGGVKGTALLGTPTLIKHPPKEAKSE